MLRKDLLVAVYKQKHSEVKDTWISFAGGKKKQKTPRAAERITIWRPGDETQQSTTADARKHPEQNSTAQVKGHKWFGVSL